MADKTIREQIRELPVGTPKRLAELMDKIYQRELDGVWPQDPRYDLLTDARVEDAIVCGPGFYVGLIEQSERNELETLRAKASGWFYQNRGVLVFATIAEWEQVKQHVSTSVEAL